VGLFYNAPEPTRCWTATGREEAKNGKREGTKRGRKGKGDSPPLFPIRYATGSGEPFAASGTLVDLTWLEDFLTSK